MKAIIYFTIISALILNYSCKNNSTESTDQKIANIEFTEILHDYGDIPLGSDGKCEFEFTNTSKNPLIINNVRTTCGCTSPEWPKSPVKPGEKGVIKIKYNTSITGVFRKSITVYSNADNSPVHLFVKGNVQTTTAIK
jgi:hypothetical protein